MYKLENNVSWTDDLKNAFKHGTTKGKIVFNNTEINYNNGLKNIEIQEPRYVPQLGFIGQATARKATINIVKESTNINLENQEIEIYIGANYNGQTYYINYGKFIVNAPPENDDTNGTIKIVAYDYMIKFNKDYVDTMVYPCTLKSLLESVCTQAGVQLGSTTFANDTFSVTDNQFEGKTLREVLQNIAKCAFSWARIGQDNKLYLDFGQKSILPDEYQQVNYIASTGTQYIDTGIYDATDIDIDFTVYGNANGQGFFGYFNTGTYFELEFYSGRVDVTYYNNTDHYVTSQGVINFSGNIRISNKTMYVNNVPKYTFSDYAGTSNQSFLLFARRRYGVPNMGKGSIMSVKIGKRGVLQFNGIPCYRKSDGEIGLYDLVTNTFFTNQGTGTFIKGDNVQHYDEEITVNDYYQDNYKKANEYYGPINKVTYGDTNIQGQEESVEDSADIALHGTKELVIYDNLFAYTTEKRHTLIQAGIKLLGLTYMPIQELKASGLVYLDSTDKLKINGGNSFVTTYNFNHIINYNGAVSDNFQTEAPSETETLYKNNNAPIQQNARTEIIVDRATKQITSIAQQIGDRSQKTTTITQDIDGIQSSVEDIEDLTNTVSANKTVTITDAYPDNDILELHIYGNNSVFNYLYPRDDLFPDDTLYPYGDSKIRFYNSDVDRTIDLGIKEVLRSNEEVKDEVFIDYDGKVVLIRRVNADGTTKAIPTETQLGILNFELIEGNNTFEIVNYTGTIEIKYVMKSTLTDIFSTKLEMNSKIEQTAQSINLEVSKKVGKEEVISSINLTPEEAQIQADKISLRGKTIDLTGENIEITSNNFNVNKNGILTAKGAKLQGVLSNYDSNTGFLAVKIDNSMIRLYDYINNGTRVGQICSIHNYETGNSGISLVGLKGKMLTIGYQEDEQTSHINALIAYDSISSDAVPYIKNTATGTLFSGLSGGGIHIKNGLITNWNISGAWSGSYYVDVGTTRYKITVEQGLMTNIEEV